MCSMDTDFQTVISNVVPTDVFSGFHFLPCQHKDQFSHSSTSLEQDLLLKSPGSARKTIEKAGDHYRKTLMQAFTMK